MSEQMCPRCAGAGVTEQTRHSVDLDENGNMVPKQESFLGPCGHYGGKGYVNS